MHSLVVFLFAIGAGLTFSGLVASIYGLLGIAPKTVVGRIVEAGVLIFAGPTTYIGNATASLKKKECSPAGYLFMLAICGFWSFATGMFVLSVFLSLRA
jgi:hypothetical protein